jgi:hypothetical protein
MGSERERAILGALFDEASAELVERLGTVRQDVGEELEALVDAHLGLTFDRRCLALIWLREQHSLSAVHRRTFLRRRQRYLQRWLNVVERLHAGVPHTALVAAMSAAQSGLMWVARLSRIEGRDVGARVRPRPGACRVESLARLPVPS